jgi:peptidoglycan-N-acetylglucosamine deacetylase
LEQVIRTHEARDGLLVTIDVEDHTVAPQRPRFAEALEPLLDALDAKSIKATFFVGELAVAERAYIEQLVAAGHEVGLHGHTHRHLPVMGERGFEDDVRRGVDALGDVLGTQPVGYRAPYFSLTRKTPWAPGVLQDAGFLYSSSVLPAWNPQGGFPGAPRHPFRWPCGLIELPSPVTGVGRFSLPLLGGAYVRLVPDALVRWAARGYSAENGGWTYSHPYDFDLGEEFFRRPGQSWPVAKLLFARRRHMLSRTTRLAAADAVTLQSFVTTQLNVTTLSSFGGEQGNSVV